MRYSISNGREKCEMLRIKLLCRSLSAAGTFVWKNLRRRLFQDETAGPPVLAWASFSRRNCWSTSVSKIKYRGIAQLVEHRSPKPSAEGSIPSAPARKKHLLSQVLFSTKFACGEWNLASPSEIAPLWNICFANVKRRISFHIERSEIFYNFRKKIISH